MKWFRIPSLIIPWKPLIIFLWRPLLFKFVISAQIVNKNLKGTFELYNPLHETATPESAISRVTTITLSPCSWNKKQTLLAFAHVLLNLAHPERRQRQMSRNSYAVSWQRKTICCETANRRSRVEGGGDKHEQKWARARKELFLDRTMIRFAFLLHRAKLLRRLSIWVIAYRPTSF